VTCTVVDCEQRSPEWFAARVGLLTATDAAAMLSTKKRGGAEEPVGKWRLRVRMAREGLYGTPSRRAHFESEAMRLGRENEAEGLGAYEAETGELVQTVGFLRHETLPIGCSPDGIVGAWEGGLELKSPEEHTHWQYVEDGKLPNEYVAQVTHSLFVTGLPWWDFCSYCPDFGDGVRLFRVRVSRADVDLDAYALALQLFLSEVEREQDKMRARSGAQELVHA
jgi:predicted phage-related endonuclease